MLNSTILDMAIGLSFVFLVLSLVASGVSEMIESVLKNRATDLERGIRELLNDSTTSNGLTARMYEHPLISSLFQGAYQPGSRTLPTYVPARNFALALMDIVLPATAGPTANGGTAGALNSTAAGAGGTTSTSGTTGTSTTSGTTGTTGTPGTTGGTAPTGTGAAAGTAAASLANFRTAIASVPDPKVRTALLALTDAAVNDADTLRQNIETWFNSSMDRVSGWYKRRSHWILFGIGLAIAVLVGASSIDIAARLATDRTMREVIASQAADAAKKSLPNDPAPGTPESKAALETRNKELAGQLNAFTAAGVFTGKPLPFRWLKLLNSRFGPVSENDLLPVRWVRNRIGPRAPADAGKNGVVLFLLDLVGCLITAFAVSLGAPFWFDLLNKFVVVRSTVKPHEKSPEEKSKA